ncbi:hypothetical protein HYY75_10580 [bacterium]|nr:hypothetical protein [bacterium]
MRPLKPQIFEEDEIRSLFELFPSKKWEFLNYLLFIGAKSSSLILSYSANPGSQNVAHKLALSLNKFGFNVFLPTSPAPISALSLALGERNFSLGIYLSRTLDGKWAILPLAPHGGLINNEDLPAIPPNFSSSAGVIGEIDLTTKYIRKIAGLLDPEPEKGVRLSVLDSPFSSIEQHFFNHKDFSVFSERDPLGPIAKVDSSGQSLSISLEKASFLSSKEMVEIIGNYLIKVRHSGGTALSPEGNSDITLEFGDSVDSVEIEGDAWDMSFKAGFVNLFMGWWDPGIIVHQGHGPFGDAFVTLGYILEALSNERAMSTILGKD